jgi:prepilin-type N-terminal cleavage/methylation domain-containing protein
MKKSMKKQGFTLVEIMIVVAIIGLLAAIAIPSFQKSREATRKNTCINNLRQIDSAKEQWALETNAADDATPEEADVTAYIKGGALPECPSDGTYTIGAMGTAPSCDVDGHALP